MHRRSARRKKKLRRKYRNRRIALVLMLVAIIGGGLFAFANLTALTDVIVTGTKVVSKNAVAKVARESMGKSYFRLNKTQLKNRLEQMPYVKEASVGLNFPHTLTIHIDEEDPFAQLYSGDGYILVNRDFLALEKTRAYDPNLPKITGVVTDGVQPGQLAFKQTGNGKKIHMIKVLFSSGLKKDINTLSILDRGMRLAFNDGTTVHILRFDNAEYKTKQLEEIRKEMKAKNENYRDIYLDQGENPVAVKPSSLEEDETSENTNTGKSVGAKSEGEDKAAEKVEKNTSKNQSEKDGEKMVTHESTNTANEEE
nr:FtsQ-type POTRA domain-containing protein [Peptoniphilus sp.]